MHFGCAQKVGIQSVLDFRARRGHAGDAQIHGVFKVGEIMIGIGVIGLGFMGYTHFEAARKLRGGKIQAIATRSEKKLRGDWRGIQGNFGPPAGKVDLSAVAGYTDYHELLADENVDLVDVCLPTDLHEQVALDALAAGKHVLVEKPISLDLKAADRMLKAAEKADRLLMVGQVLPYFPEFRYAAECISSGKHGRLLSAHFNRVIAPPDWSADMADFRKLGGWGIDLHIHDNHFISLVCGAPDKVVSRGMLQDGLVNHVHTQYVYDGRDLAATAVSGGVAPAGLDFLHGFQIQLEQAMLLYSAGTIGGEWVVDRPLTQIAGKRVTQPRLKGGDEWCSAFTAELQSAVNAVKDGKPAPILDGRLARNALAICLAEAKSIETGKSVKIAG